MRVDNYRARNMILYFSATGNCKYVAEPIAAEFDDTAVRIEVSNGQGKFLRKCRCLHRDASL